MESKVSGTDARATRGVLDIRKLDLGGLWALPEVMVVDEKDALARQGEQARTPSNATLVEQERCLVQPQQAREPRNGFSVENVIADTRNLVGKCLDCTHTGDCFVLRRHHRDPGHRAVIVRPHNLNVVTFVPLSIPEELAAASATMDAATEE